MSDTDDEKGLPRIRVRGEIPEGVREAMEAQSKAQAEQGRRFAEDYKRAQAAQAERDAEREAQHEKKMNAAIAASQAAAKRAKDEAKRKEDRDNRRWFITTCLSGVGVAFAIGLGLWNRVDPPAPASTPATTAVQASTPRATTPKRTTPPASTPKRP